MHHTHLNRAAALALTLATSATHAGEPKQTIMPEDPEARAFQEAVGFSDAVVHGDTIVARSSSCAGLCALLQCFWRCD